MQHLTFSGALISFIFYRNDKLFYFDTYYINYVRLCIYNHIPKLPRLNIKIVFIFFFCFKIDLWPLWLLKFRYLLNAIKNDDLKRNMLALIILLCVCIYIYIERYIDDLIFRISITFSSSTQLYYNNKEIAIVKKLQYMYLKFFSIIFFFQYATSYVWYSGKGQSILHLSV